MTRFPKSLTTLFAALAIVGAAASCAYAGDPLAGRGRPWRPLPQAMQSQAGPYELQVLVDGMPAPVYGHRGESYVLGHLGARYTLRVINRSGRRVEAVVSVDGRDVVGGRTGGWSHQRGYLVNPWGYVDIDGWRLSTAEVAAFRFSRVADSYAARTGSARNVGVIGVAVFPERAPPRPLYLPPPPISHWEREAPRAPSRSDGRRPAPAPADEMSEGGAPKSRSAESRSAEARPGLGTEFGEAMASRVEEVPFEREQQHPSAIIGVRYNDREGLLAMGVHLGDVYPWDYEPELRRTADPFPVSQRPFAAPPSGWWR